MKIELAKNNVVYSVVDNMNGCAESIHCSMRYMMI